MLGRMSSVPLVFCNLDGASFGILLIPGARKNCEMMSACVIMHNMIIEDERPKCLYDQGFQFQGENVVLEHGGGAAMFA